MVQHVTRLIPWARQHRAVDIDEELRRISLVNGRQALATLLLVATADDGVRLPCRAEEAGVAAILVMSLRPPGSPHPETAGGRKT